MTVQWDEWAARALVALGGAASVFEGVAPLATWLDGTNNVLRSLEEDPVFALIQHARQSVLEVEREAQ